MRNLEHCLEVNTDSHHVTACHSTILFSNDEVYPTRSVTFMLASLHVAVLDTVIASEPNL